jgi:hypothetical protein
VLARVKVDSTRFSMRFVVPLSWRHDHLIEVRKVKGPDLVEGANDWITVTPPRPSLALSTDTVHAGSGVRVVVSGLPAHQVRGVQRDDPRDRGSGERRRRGGSAVVAFFSNRCQRPRALQTHSPRRLAPGSSDRGQEAKWREPRQRCQCLAHRRALTLETALTSAAPRSVT